MGIFSKKVSLRSEAKKMFEEAYSMSPTNAGQISAMANTKAAELEKNTKTEFKGLKIILAFALVIFIFIMAYFAGQDDNLKEMYKILLHAGEISLGGLIGILIGEAGK